MDIHYMVLITCKKCGDIGYLASEALGNDDGYKCRNCEKRKAISTIKLENEELKKYV